MLRKLRAFYHERFVNSLVGSLLKMNLGSKVYRETIV